MASTTLSSVQYSGDLIQVLEEVSKELPVGPVVISYPLLFIPTAGSYAVLHGRPVVPLC